MAFHNFNPTEDIGSVFQRVVIGLFLFLGAGFFGAATGSLCEAFSGWDNFLSPVDAISDFFQEAEHFGMFAVFYAPMGVGAIGALIIAFNLVAGYQLIFSEDAPWLWVVGIAFGCTIGSGFGTPLPQLILFSVFVFGYAILALFLIQRFWPEYLDDFAMLNPGLGEEALQQQLDEGSDD